MTSWTTSLVIVEATGSEAAALLSCCCCEELTSGVVEGVGVDTLDSRCIEFVLGVLK